MLRIVVPSLVPAVVLAVILVLATTISAPAPQLAADHLAATVPARSGGAPAARTSAHPRVYYVSPRGSDSASGRSPAHAWRSLGRVSQAPMGPGDSVLLARGGFWRGSLHIGASGTRGTPIRVGAYGSGALPAITGGCATLGGSWIVVSQVRAQRCRYAGFLVLGNHDTVQHVVSTHNISGVTIRPGGDHSSVLHSRIIDNDRMAPNTPGPDDDYGAFGVEVQANQDHVAWNLITGSIAKSHDYGTDGSAVEVYGSHGTVVDHNRAFGDLTFTELGKRGTRNSTFAYNLVRSGLANGGFIVTRGIGDYFGPVLHTVAIHNTAVLTGTGSQDFWCGGTCDDRILSVSDNIFEAVARIGYAASHHSHGREVGGRVGGGHNLFWGHGTTGGGVRRAPSDRVANPQFASSSRLNLRRSSPAVDAGSVIGHWTTDVYGQPIDDDGSGRTELGAVAYHHGP